MGAQGATKREKASKPAKASNKASSTAGKAVAGHKAAVVDHKLAQKPDREQPYHHGDLHGALLKAAKRVADGTGASPSAVLPTDLDTKSRPVLDTGYTSPSRGRHSCSESSTPRSSASASVRASSSAHRIRSRSAMVSATTPDWNVTDFSRSARVGASAA